MRFDFDLGRRDSVYAIRSPRSTDVVAGLVILAIYAFGMAVEYFNLTHDPIITRDRNGFETQYTGLMRWIVIGGTSFLFFVCPWILPFLMRIPRFAIRKDGLFVNLKGEHRSISWAEIQDCHWNRIQPRGSLVVQLPHEQVLIVLPEPDIAQVEAELRRFGKWRE